MKTRDLEDNRQWVLNNSQEPTTVYDYARKRDILLLPGQTAIITKAPETRQTRKKQEKSAKHEEKTENIRTDITLDINTSAD